MAKNETNNIADLRGDEIGHGLQEFLRRARLPLFSVIGLLICWLTYSQASHSFSILKILIGSVVVFAVWHRHRSPGLPIILVVATQTLFVYALPLVTLNEDLRRYSTIDVSHAATEVLIFGICLAIGWSVGIAYKPAKFVSVWNFRFVGGENSSKVIMLSLILISCSLLFQIALLSGTLDQLLDQLPAGMGSILNTISQATSMGGGLLGGFAIGGNVMSAPQRLLFWTIFWLTFAFLISGYLLSNATGLMSAVTLGFLIGGRRLPVALLITLATVCSFYNLTKFEMRQQYWDPETSSTQQHISELPDRFAEWTDRSFEALTSPTEHRENKSDAEQRLSDRVNNTSTLLFVQDAILHRNIPSLSGKTYSLIPQLLVPRIFWAAKPRAHAGQELLNVHFERQTLEETYRTYIAWGLLAEAYGNFGPFWGALILGIPFGWLLGRVEAWSRSYALKTLQSFLILTFMVQVGTSFEMVASIFVTSTFQLMAAIAASTWLLIDRRRLPSNPSHF